MISLQVASGHREDVRQVEAAPTGGSRHHLGLDINTASGPTPEVMAVLRRLRAEMQEEVSQESLPLNLQPAPRRAGLVLPTRGQAHVSQRLGKPSQGFLQQQEVAFSTAGWQASGCGAHHDSAGYEGLLVGAGGQEHDTEGSMQAASTTDKAAEQLGSSAVMNHGPGSARTALPNWQAVEPARGDQGRPAGGWQQQPAFPQALELQLQHATSLDRLAAARAQLAAAAEHRAQQWAQLEALASGHVAQQPGAPMQAEGHASADVVRRQPPAGRSMAPRQAAAERRSRAAGSPGQQPAGGLQVTAQGRSHAAGSSAQQPAGALQAAAGRRSDAIGSSEQQPPARPQEPETMLCLQQCPASAAAEARQAAKEELSHAATLTVQQAAPAAAAAVRDSANDVAVARQLCTDKRPGAATWAAQPPAAELPAPAVTVTAQDAATDGAGVRQALAHGRSAAAGSAGHSPPRQPGSGAGSPASAPEQGGWPVKSLTGAAHQTAAGQSPESAACQQGAPQLPAAALELPSSCHEEELAARPQLQGTLQGGTPSACDLDVQYPQHRPALWGVGEESAASMSSPGSPAADGASVDAPSTRHAESRGTRQQEVSDRLGTPGRAQQPSEARSMPAHSERPVLTVGRAFALLGIQLDSGMDADSLRAAAMRQNAASLHAPLSVKLHAVQVRPNVMVLTVHTCCGRLLERHTRCLDCSQWF